MMGEKGTPFTAFCLVLRRYPNTMRASEYGPLPLGISSGDLCLNCSGKG